MGDKLWPILKGCVTYSIGVLRITISTGVAAVPSAAITRPEQLVACADQALYRAKAGGRNRVEVFDG